ncbi:hypothetical protein FRC07_007909, partial [Ceratobasidium sp. 392]
MSSRRSKRDGFRAFLTNPGPALKDMFRSRSPAPSWSSANRSWTQNPTPTSTEPAAATTSGLASEPVRLPTTGSTVDTPTLAQQPGQLPTPMRPSTPGPWSTYMAQPTIMMPPDQVSANLAKLDPSTKPEGAGRVEEPVELKHQVPKSVWQPATQVEDTASGVLKTALGAAKKGVSVVSTFKGVSDMLASCIDSIPTAAENRKDFDDLTSSISAVRQDLEEHLSRVNPEQMSKAVSDAIGKLNQLAAHIDEKQARTQARAYLDAEKDIDDLVEYYRDVEALLRRLQSNAVLNIWRIANENMNVANEGLANTLLAGLNPVREALYDSSAASQVRRRGCTPDTRQLVLKELLDWASDAHGAKVYWMNGMAGTGKTTIAYSFCSELESAEQLAASFFCTRLLPECQDVSRIVPMIAYQLAHFCRPIKEVLCRRLSNDPMVSIRGLTTQFEKLVSTPLRDVRDRLPTVLPIVVIDALDECSSRGDAVLFLSALLRCAGDLPVKFFVTCRPDSVLLGKLSAGGNIAHSLLHLHDIEESLVQADIKTYLKQELETLLVASDQIDRLTRLSGKLFIYAATA